MTRKAKRRIRRADDGWEKVQRAPNGQFAPGGGSAAPSQGPPRLTAGQKAALTKKLKAEAAKKAAGATAAAGAGSGAPSPAPAAPVPAQAAPVAHVTLSAGQKAALTKKLKAAALEKQAAAPAAPAQAGLSAEEQSKLKHLEWAAQYGSASAKQHLELNGLIKKKNQVQSAGHPVHSPGPPKLSHGQKAALTKKLKAAGARKSSS